MFIFLDVSTEQLGHVLRSMTPLIININISIRAAYVSFLHMINTYLSSYLAQCIILRRHFLPIRDSFPSRHLSSHFFFNSKRYYYSQLISIYQSKTKRFTVQQFKKKTTTSTTCNLLQLFKKKCPDTLEPFPCSKSGAAGRIF